MDRPELFLQPDVKRLFAIAITRHVENRMHRLRAGGETLPCSQGWLRLRASQSNLDSAFHADIDSDESVETMERLRLQIWPAEFEPPVAAKRWQAPL